jgi:hypothetical protein
VLPPIGPSPLPNLQAAGQMLLDGAEALALGQIPALTAQEGADLLRQAGQVAQALPEPADLAPAWDRDALPGESSLTGAGPAPALPQTPLPEAIVVQPPAPPRLTEGPWELFELAMQAANCAGALYGMQLCVAVPTPPTCLFATLGMLQCGMDLWRSGKASLPAPAETPHGQ